MRGRLVLDGKLVQGAVIVEAGRIADVIVGGTAGAGLPPAVEEADIVSPGFIDVQVNGAFGLEVADGADAIREIAARLPATGVTSFLPTLVSSTAEEYVRVLRAFRGSRDAAGARPLGLHLEGPLLSPGRAGAHRLSAIEGARVSRIAPLLDAGVVRVVTLAPELNGALEEIRALCERGVVVSLGHTDASYEEFEAGVDAGATMATHLYNAMSGFLHREPGAVGAALLDDRVSVGLIADGVHSHPASVRLALRAKGPERVVLVTDATAGSGAEPGAYTLGGREILADERRAVLRDGRLAGSVLTLDQAVRNVVEWTGAGVACACRMASEVPARLLGLEAAGRLAAGFDADLTLLDAELRVVSTYRGGRCLYRRGERGPEPARRPQRRFAVQED